QRFVQFVEQGTETADLARTRVRRTTSSGALNGKLAVGTGAGSGIGRETLLLFAQQGAEVVAADIHLEAAERSAAEARAFGVSAHALQVDVGSAEAMQQFANDVIHTIGTPDIVVNNAGIGVAGAFMDTSDAEWEKVLRVNLWGVIRGSRLFAQRMIAMGKRGHLVNVASAAAFTPSRVLSAYATSKAA